VIIADASPYRMYPDAADPHYPSLIWPLTTRTTPL